MQLKYGLISVDDHVQEPPDLWTSRLSKKWGERIPRLERAADGAERWVVDGQTVLDGHAAKAGALMTDRNREPARWEEVPPAAYRPSERLKAMDDAGVDYSVLYPTVPGMAGEVFARIQDPDLELACVQAYNDWLIDEWTAKSPRFIPQCIVPLSSVDAAVEEIQRAVKKGHKGVIYPALPMEHKDAPHINEPVYDKLWATCQDLAVPICFHAGSSPSLQMAPYQGYSTKIRDAFDSLTRPPGSIFVVVNLMLSKIPLRFPKLKFVFSESAVGWGSYLLEYADYQFDNDQLSTEGYPLKPSETFARQCYLTGWYDSVSLKERGLVGLDNILWSSNFPLVTSTWPDTQELLAKSFQELSEEEQDKILWKNAAELYKVEI